MDCGPWKSWHVQSSLHLDSFSQFTAVKLTKIMSASISQLSTPYSTAHFGCTTFPVVLAFVKMGGNSPLFLPPISKKTLKSMAEWKLSFLASSTCTVRSNLFGYFMTVSRDLCNADIGISRSVFYRSSLLERDLFSFHQAEENAPCPAEAFLSFEIGLSISSVFFEIASVSAW